MVPRLALRELGFGDKNGREARQWREELYPLALVESTASARLYVEVSSPCSTAVYVFQRQLLLARQEAQREPAAAIHPLKPTPAGASTRRR
jgi:hypothetical protein